MPRSGTYVKQLTGYQAASTIVSQFEKAGILRESTGRKRDKRFVYSDYLNILAEGTNI